MLPKGPRRKRLAHHFEPSTKKTIGRQKGQRSICFGQVRVESEMGNRQQAKPYEVQRLAHLQHRARASDRVVMIDHGDKPRHPPKRATPNMGNPNPPAPPPAPQLSLCGKHGRDGIPIRFPARFGHRSNSCTPSEHPNPH